MIKVKNLATNEVVKVFNIERVNNNLFAARNPVTNRFLNSYPFMERAGKDDEGRDLVRIKEGSGYTITGNYRKGVKVSAKVERPKVQDVEEKHEIKPVHDIKPVEVEDVRPQDEKPAEVKETPKDDAQDDVAQLAAILGRMKGGNIDGDAVRAIVREELAAVKPAKVEHVVKVADLPERKVEGFTHPAFDEVLTLVVNDRAIGRFPWLYGEAGSGKSTMAAQVAQALGLPFYCVSSLQQKYELEGYADASGQLVETVFYKAWTEGGVFCFDEASTSPAEVQVAFNTALAQLVYTFPVVGTIPAHKDFHVIAADNTAGRGGNKTYHARFQLDASTLDRYTFTEVGYTMQGDMYAAQDDEALVKLAQAIRVELRNANSTYLCTPRALKAVKRLQACGMDDAKALELGLFSGWDKQAKRTIINAVTPQAGTYSSALASIFETL